MGVCFEQRLPTQHPIVFVSAVRQRGLPFGCDALQYGQSGGLPRRLLCACH